MNVKKGLSLTMTIIVTAVILLIVAFLLVSITNDTVGRTMSNIANVLGISENTASCNALRAKCESACASLSTSGSGTNDVTVQFQGEQVTCGSDPQGCTTGWTCSAGG